MLCSRTLKYQMWLILCILNIHFTISSNLWGENARQQRNIDLIFCTFWWMWFHLIRQRTEGKKSYREEGEKESYENALSMIFRHSFAWWFCRKVRVEIRKLCKSYLRMFNGIVQIFGLTMTQQTIKLQSFSWNPFHEIMTQDIQFMDIYSHSYTRISTTHKKI